MASNLDCGTLEVPKCLQIVQYCTVTLAQETSEKQEIKAMPTFRLYKGATKVRGLYPVWDRTGHT